MPSTTITLDHSKAAAAVLPWSSLPVSSETEKTAAALAAVLDSVAGGAMDATLTAVLSSNPGSPAWGTITIASGSGTITATINGVAISVTWTSSDTATATALAAAIKASTHQLVSGVVTASASSGVVTISSFAYSKATNSITLAASGTGATASGSRLTGGSGQDVAPTSYGAPAVHTANGTSNANSDQVAVQFLYFY